MRNDNSFLGERGVVVDLDDCDINPIAIYVPICRYVIAFDISCGNILQFSE